MLYCVLELFQCSVFLERNSKFKNVVLRENSCEKSRSSLFYSNFSLKGSVFNQLLKGNNREPSPRKAGYRLNINELIPLIGFFFLTLRDLNNSTFVKVKSTLAALSLLWIFYIKALVATYMLAILECFDCFICKFAGCVSKCGGHSTLLPTL